MIISNKKFSTLLFIALVIVGLRFIIDILLYYAGVVRLYNLSNSILITKTLLSLGLLVALFFAIRIRLTQNANTSLETSYSFIVLTVKWLCLVFALILAVFFLCDLENFGEESIGGETFQFPLTIKGILGYYFFSILFCVFLSLLLNLRLSFFVYDASPTRLKWFVIWISLVVVFSLFFSDAFYFDFFEVYKIVLIGLIFFGVLPFFTHLNWIFELSHSQKKKTFVLLLLTIGFFIYIVINPRTRLHVLNFNLTTTLIFFFLSSYLFIYFLLSCVVIGFHLPSSNKLFQQQNDIQNIQAMNRFVVSFFNKEEIYNALLHHSCQLIRRHVSGYVAHWDSSKELGKISSSSNFSERMYDLFSEYRETVEIMFRSDNLVAKTIKSLNTHSAKPVFSFRSQSTHLHILCVPLASHKQHYGKLFLFSIDDRPFSSSETNLISILCEQASAALHNETQLQERIRKQRIEHELKLSQIIQQQLLPHTYPKLSGVDMHAVSFPAYEIGGDYYDYVLVDPHTLSFIVADVSGKSMPASFYMSEFKGIFNALARITHSPKQLMISSHHAIIESLSSQTFISAVHGTLNTKNCLLTISNAGHLPFIHVSNNQISYINNKGPAIGLFKKSRKSEFDNKINQIELQLEEDDIVIFYTDGITESFSEKKEEFGFDRLAKTVLTHRSRSVEIIIARILEEIADFTKGSDIKKQDDLTILAIKINKCNVS